jgi:hypothetical protein
LTVEASDETSEVHIRKETVRERRWRSFKHRMNENQTVAQMKSRTWMTNVPSGTCPGLGALLPRPRPLTHPVPAMPWPSTDAMAWVHGLGSLTWHAGGPHSPGGATRRDGSRGTAHVQCQRGGGRGWPRGHGGVSGYRKKPEGKENSHEVEHVLPDRR